MAREPWNRSCGRFCSIRNRLTDWRRCSETSGELPNWCANASRPTAWRILESLTRTPEVPWRAHAIGDAVKLLNTMIQNLSAITGMIQENMTRGYGWRLLDMGRRIERTRYAARLIRGHYDAG